MFDFISKSKREKAGILAAALAISAFVSGCNSSKPGNGTSTVPSIPPTIESPDKIYVEEATKEVMDYYDENGETARPFWLDVELLTKEVAYARSLIDAYENGTCPSAIEKEVALLVEINNKGFASAGTFSGLISALNTLYNAVANIDSLQFETSTRSNLSSLNVMISKNIVELDEFAIKYYKLAKVIHEGCCVENHSIKNSEGYSYCTSLDEANDILYDDYDKVFSLRLTK